MTDSDQAVKRYLEFRGKITGFCAENEFIHFVTEHGEGQSTGVYLVDVDKDKLRFDPLPAGGTALVKDEKKIYAAGTDLVLYCGNVKGGALAPLGDALPGPVTSIVLLSKNRLAALCSNRVCILNREDGALLRTLTLSEYGTALAADDSGTWLAAGSTGGTISVFTGEESDEFVLSNSKKLHTGAVTSLLFEKGELRLLSTGIDLKLLVTHIRGELEPEDRSGQNNHQKNIQAMMNYGREQFYTAGKDKTVKLWASGFTKRRPSSYTFTGNGLEMGLVSYNGKPHVALAGEDYSIKLFPINEEGRLDEAVLILYDAYTRAKNELQRDDANAREKALKKLASYNDSLALRIISRRAAKDQDKSLRLLAATLIGESDNSQAIKLLQELLSSNDEKVQVAAFKGLRKQEGENSLRPINLALSNESAKSDGHLGKAAVQALTELAPKDDLAMQALVGTLNAEPLAVRLEALKSLESLGDADSPEADLLALHSNYTDIRIQALERFLQRGFLDKPEIAQALRKYGNDPEPEVRRINFLISLLSRPPLAKVLRSLDEATHRNLHDLENRGRKKEEKKDLSKPEKEDVSRLTEEDYRPLLEAMAGRELDVSLMGATALAVLHDPRALGSLLQLSREKEEAVRVQVCRALKSIADPRAIDRLRMMLYDQSSQVKDAAFSALTALEKDNPLSAVEAALNTEDENIRHRGLQLLLKQLKKIKKTEDEAEFYGLLERLLNDSSYNIRREAFKSILNLELAGGGENTLRFLLHSIHYDIRNDVLTEIKANIKQAWAFPMLMELLNDPGETIRLEALQFGLKKFSRDTLNILKDALSSSYSDIRKEAAIILTKGHVDIKDNLSLLLLALEDKDIKIRQFIVETLIKNDARDELTGALKSSYKDVCLNAACALARYGDTTALPSLLEMVTREKEEKEQESAWEQNVLRALDGLKDLAAVESFDAIQALMKQKSKKIQEKAARTLAYICDPSHRETLRRELKHANERVKKEIARALAYLGDSSGSSIVFKDQTKESLLAALLLGEEKEEYLLDFIDHSNQALRNLNILLLMLLEDCERKGSPKRLLTGLSSSSPHTRLLTAQALENYPDKDNFHTYVQNLFNDRGDRQEPWRIKPEIIKTLGTILAYGNNKIRLFAFFNILDKLMALKNESDSRQRAFDYEWKIFSTRFADEIKAIEEQASSGEAEVPQYSKEELYQLILGTYIGLSRLQGGDFELGIRQSALLRLRDLAQKEASLSATVYSVYLAALHDSNGTVRKQALDNLLGMDSNRETLVKELLATEHVDIGKQGLDLLAEDLKKKGHLAVIKDVFTAYTNGLEKDAAQILMKTEGTLTILKAGLEVRSQSQRKNSISELTRILKESDDQEEKDQVIAVFNIALNSRYRDVKSFSASNLAKMKESVAFDTLKEMLSSDEAGIQQEAIQGLLYLGDPRTPGILLDRVEKDHDNTAQSSPIFKAVGSFRDPESAPRLFKFFKDGKKVRAAYDAVLKISGYDQEVEDEKKPKWEKDTYKRHDSILEQLLRRLYEVQNESLLKNLLTPAQLAPSDAVDPMLATLSRYPSDDIRNEALYAIGWRLKYRDGSRDPLLEALTHPDGRTKFLAARELALDGHKEGLNILLAGVDLLSSDSDREDAVLALGHLADDQAVDTLLRFANDEMHELHEVSLEAIGHMKESKKSSEIFTLLSDLAADDDSEASLSALSGLRWYNNRAAWEIIRGRAKDYSWEVRDKVAQLLEFNDDQVSRDLLAYMIKNDDDVDVVSTAARSLINQYDKDSLEPYYIILQTDDQDLLEEIKDDIKRLYKEGNAARLLELLPKLDNKDFIQGIIKALLDREVPPIDEVCSVLKSGEPKSLYAAARVLGSVNPELVDGTQAKLLEKKLDEIWKKWQVFAEGRETINENEGVRPQRDLPEACAALVWACGRFSLGKKIFLDILEVNDAAILDIRKEAILALTMQELSAKELDILEKRADEADAVIRPMALSCIGLKAPDRVNSLLKKNLEDRPSVNSLLIKNIDTVSKELLFTSARQIHSQGIVLPHLVTGTDVSGLEEGLTDTELSEEARLGLIEALGAMATPESQDALVSFAKKDEEDPELRKAAWRALRRSKRQRKKNAETETLAGNGA
ncbi:MAG: hypothetical protein GY754_41140 [bacterium]|nr:hypothetical protein [bacterium]